MPMFNYCLTPLVGQEPIQGQITDCELATEMDECSQFMSEDLTLEYAE